MSSAGLFAQSHVFGVNCDIVGNIWYLDEQTVLYPAGSQLIIYNIEQKTQRFVTIAEGDGISTMAITGTAPSNPGNLTANMGTSQSTNLPIVIAVAVRSEERGPSVVLVDLQATRRRKILSPGDGTQSKEFISIAFSHDGKNIIGQSGAPDWNLYYWGYEKPKLYATIRSTSNANAEIHQMSCNPYDSGATQVCVTGNGIFRIFRYSEGNFKLLSQQKSDKNLLCHTWVSDTRVVAGTEDSKLLVYDSGDLILEISYTPPLSTISIPTTPSEFPDTPSRRLSTSILTVIAFSGGLIAGTSFGMCVLFEKTEDNFLFKKVKEFMLEEAAVRSISLSPTDDTAVCTLINSQIYLVTLDSDSSKGEEIKCDRLCQPFHHKQIVGMDTCARKPLIATCGQDKSVRIWNYADNSIEVVRFFEDEPQSIALHPSGLYVLVGFSDSLKLMNVLIDDVRPYWELNIRGCRECRFSNGGHYFASVYGSTIGIHSTWSFDTVTTLKGHQGKVKSIMWNQDDSHLVSCGIDGSVFDWNIRTGRRDGEVNTPDVVHTSACYTSDSKLIYTVGNDGILREICESRVNREFPIKGNMIHLLISRTGKLFFGATAHGRVRATKYPFGADLSGLQNDYQETMSHSGAVSRIRLSYDDQFLFTCGEDGCLWVYKVLDKETRSFKREKEWSYSDEILVTKSDLKDNYKIMNELKQRVEELKADNETQLRLKDLNYSEKLRELTEKYMMEIEGLKEQTEMLKNERETNERMHMQELDSFRTKYRDEINMIDTAFNKKMEVQNEKYFELNTKTAELKRQWETQISDTEKFHKARLQEISEYYKRKIQERQDEILQLKSQFGRQKVDFESNLREIEVDTEEELLQIAHHFETKLRDERDSLSVIREENSAMKHRYDCLTKEIEDHKQELAKMFYEEKRLHSIIKSFEKDIVGVKREMQERDDTIQDKEKRIYDLKKKNQELEKFKFVLDYKIMELKKQVEPRERDIVTLSNQIKEMDIELHAYHKRHDVLNTAIQDLLMKVKATEHEANVETWKGREVRSILRRIQGDLKGLGKDPEDLDMTKKKVVAMFHKYANTPDELPQPPPEAALAPANESEDGPKDDEIEEAQQREHLESTAKTLRHELNKGASNRYAENLRIMQENVALLTEINSLRKDLKASQKRTQRLNNAINHGTTLSPEDLKLILPRRSKPNSTTSGLLGNMPGQKRVGLPTIPPSEK